MVRTVAVSVAQPSVTFDIMKPEVTVTKPQSVITKPQPQWMPEAFVRIGSVPSREIQQPVTVVGNWGSEGIARIGPATNEVSPK